MLSLGRMRGKGIEKQPPEGAKRLENAKKMLNRTSEPSILLKTNGPVNFRVKNELKTNSFFDAKTAKPKRSCTHLAQTPGNSRKAYAGARVEGGQSQSPLRQTQY